MYSNSRRIDSFWPQYNKIERKAIELGESTLHGKHRIISDVHGGFCRMIDEAKAFVKQKNGWFLESILEKCDN